MISSKTSGDSDAPFPPRPRPWAWEWVRVGSECIVGMAGAPRKSAGSGLHCPSGTSTVTRHVKLCCCRERLSVGYSLRTMTVGAGIGFLATLALGLLSAVSIEWTS